MLQLSEWTLRSSAWVVFNNVLIIDATDKSKISSTQNRSPFKTLNLNRNPTLCKDVSKIYLRRTQIFEDYEPGRFSFFYLVFNLYTFLLSLSSIFVFFLFCIRFSFDFSYSFVYVGFECIIFSAPFLRSLKECKGIESLPQT